MHDPILYHLHRAHPDTVETGDAPFKPRATMRCAHERRYWIAAHFTLAHHYHDAKDLFISTLEIAAQRDVHLPIACTHHDLHGCYVANGRLSLSVPRSGATLALQSQQYALIYAPRGDYRLAVAKGSTTIYLWSTNGRLLLRHPKHRAFGPLHTLLHHWKNQAIRCHHTRILPFSRVVGTTWIQLLQLPKLKPLLLDNRLHDLLAQLIYCCIEDLEENPGEASKPLRLLHAVRTAIIRSLRKGNVPRIAELAERQGLSTQYLQRIHRQHYGISIKSYITRKRLRHARYLLTVRRLPVRTTAYLVGYGSVEEFTKAFNKFFGYVPRST